MADLRVGIVLQAVDRATAPLRGLSRSAGGTQAAIARLGGQASQLGKLRGLRTEVGALGSKLDVSRRKTAELGRELKRTDDPSEKLRKAFERSRSQTVALARAHGRQRGELRDLSASLRKAGIDTRRLNAEQERLDRTSGRLQRRLDRLGRTDASPRRGGGFGAGLAGGVLGTAVFSGARAIPRMFGGFVEAADKREQVMATLSAIRKPGEDVRKTWDWISDFAATTPFQIDRVAESFVQLRAYGMDPTKGGLLRTLGDTASVMGKDVMDAVEAIAAARNRENDRLRAFGITARIQGDTVTYEYGDDKVATANLREKAEVQRVLTRIMAEQYSGGMAAKMKTYSGMVSNLGDQWFRFRLMVMDGGPFDFLKGKLAGVLGRVNELAAGGDLEKLANKIGKGITDAFETFETKVWPILKNDVWPALKDIAGVLGEIFRGANQVANAVGGWGTVLKAFAAYKALSIGGGLLAGGRRRIGTALEFGRDVRDALASPTAKRMRGSAGRLATGGFRMARSGLGTAVNLGSAALGAGKSGMGRAFGGLARFGRTLGSLALRFAPLLMGALKALGAVFAGLSLPVTAAVAAIAGAAFLVWKHWEPIKGFFSKLWEGVRAAFSAAWKRLSSIDWGGLGKRLLATLAKGIKSAPGLVWDALKGGLGKLADLLPGSDARAGPLSRLTASGSAILSTMGRGVARGGAGPLQRPLSRALATAAAGLALSVPGVALSPPSPGPFAREAPARPLEERLRAALRPSAPPAPAAPPVSRPGTPASGTVHHHYRIEIRQQPGEDPQDLAERVIRELERRQARAGREALGDAL